ncbi:amidohydrolase [Chitinibacteraceae bacterium HSL-7]
MPICRMLGAAALLTSSALYAAPAADVIYHGGQIVTMDELNMVTKAVAVRNGRVLAVGEFAALQTAHQGKNTRVVDLAGKTMLPGFIDAHSHFINALTMSKQANVSAPPVGPASSPDEIVAALKTFADEKLLPPGELLMGYGYDENLMPEGQPLTRRALDAAFPDRPVLVMHVSLHGAVLNSLAMQRFGISADTPTPAGGVIVREAGSQEPAGLIMETAFLPVFAQLPRPTREQEKAQILAAQQRYAAAGITTAQEGATHADQVALLARAASAGQLYLDVVAYPFITDLDAVLKKTPAKRFGQYRNRFKLGGCKITLDGSPQGRTAFFSTPYLTDGPNGEKDWSGEPTFNQTEFESMLGRCYGKGLQTLIHANGDAAIGMAIAGHKAVTGKDAAKDRRTVIVHAQFARPDQLYEMAQLKLIPSFYTEHTYFFAGAHLKNRGQEQASFISPMKTALGMGLKPTNHTDFNVLPINQLWTVWTAVARESREGAVIGPRERISRIDALKAITIHAAFQYGEEKSKGSITPGKLADLVVLDANPLTVETSAIRDIKVLETIKNGRTVYLAN